MSSVSEIYLLESLKSFKGMKSNAELAIAQISDEELHFQPDSESNSVAIIMRHIAGNLRSRFTDFLTTDGEKPNRNRDIEFENPTGNRQEILADWNNGWEALFSTLNGLKGEDLLNTITIRNEPHSVLRAIQRQLVHYAYHCGQIVFLCKMIRKSEFQSLSIPRGKSEEYNKGMSASSR